MRKLLLSLVCTLFVAGGIVIADQYTIVSYDKDKKVVTLKDKGGKEVTGKLTDDTKVYRLVDGNKVEGKLGGLEKAWSSDKAVGRKVELTIKDGKITEVTTKGGKKK